MCMNKDRSQRKQLSEVIMKLNKIIISLEKIRDHSIKKAR